MTEPKEPYVPGFSGQLANRANYRGDVTHAVMTQRKPFGPDLFGATYTPVSAAYDSEADLTRVQFQTVRRTNRRAHEPSAEELAQLTRQQRRQLQRLTTSRQDRKSRRSKR